MRKQSVNLTFRKGTKKDIAQIKELTWLAYSQYADVISKTTLQEWETNLRSEKTYVDLLKIANCFVCEYDAKIIGSIFLIPHGNPFKLFPSDWAYIRLLGVDPEFGGQGIGQRLTEMCLNQAKKNKEKIIGLHTSEFQNAARHIYENLGFVQQKQFELYGKKYWIYKLELNKI